MKFRLLVDNKTEDVRCHAEWGLSILIETDGHQILFDTGCSSMFAENAKAMGIDLAKVEAAVISHGHYDHTEGVPAFIAVNQTAPIYLHKDALYETYGETDGELDSEDCGIRWKAADREKIMPRLVYTEGVYPLFDGVTLVGNIPDMAGFPPTEQFHRRIVDKAVDGTETVRWEDDPMTHEQALVIEEEKGLYIFSGCCHRGVVPTIRYIQQLYPGKRIAGLVAGMHLCPVSAAERERIVEEIAALHLDCVFPVHCTGMEAIILMRQKMGEKCVIASAGDAYAY